MPMNSDVLAAAVAAEFGASPTDFLKKFCAAVVAHIQTNAQINGVAAVGLVSATGGPVTGTVILPPGSIA